MYKKEKIREDCSRIISHHVRIADMTKDTCLLHLPYSAVGNHFPQP